MRASETSRPSNGWITPERPGWTTTALRAVRREFRRRSVQLMLVALPVGGAGALLAMSRGGKEDVVSDIGRRARFPQHPAGMGRNDRLLVERSQWAVSRNPRCAAGRLADVRSRSGDPVTEERRIVHAVIIINDGRNQ